MHEPRIRLVLLGALTLMLELALIRFLGAWVWNLGYFPNLVLLAAFVGMGAGFVFHHVVSAERSASVYAAGAWGVAALVVLAVYVRPGLPGFASEGGAVGGEVYYTFVPADGAGASAAASAVWFVLVIVIFAFLSQRTAKLFAQWAPLEAYSLEVGGSLAGVLGFMAVSALRLPAWSWFVTLGVLAVAAAPRLRVRLAVAVPLAAAALVAWHGDQRPSALPDDGRIPEVRWSPYQKVEYVAGPVGYLFVNGIFHQNMLPSPLLDRSFYVVPYRSRPAGTTANVLVIGAGSGNDVAAALAHGAGHVDAVEIDPVIAALGARHHPMHPLTDPRVDVTVTDGRAFLTSTRKRYDVIVFALTDSIVKVSPVAQLRLENYLFTVEALRRAWELIEEGGDLILYNYYRSDMVLAKNVLLLERATGSSPVFLVKHEGLSMMMVRRGVTPPAPSHRTSLIEPTTDDWPFPYLPMRGVPGLYLGAMAAFGVLVLLLALAVRATSGPATRTPLTLRLSFLLMGSAFLLLETKGIIQFSLLFGTTWVNNSLVFVAVLVLVLCANGLAPRLGPAALPVAFSLLLAFCLLSWAVPLAWLLAVEDRVLRFVAAALLTFLPVFFSNLIFSLAFRDRSRPEHLFGWNLVGATLGGVLEYTSMAVGYRALSAVVALCYVAAYLLLRHATALPRADPAPEPAPA